MLPWGDCRFACRARLNFELSPQQGGRPILLTTELLNFPPPAGAWDELARLYRQVCSLRLQGRGREAQALDEGELATAVAAVRAHSGPGAEIDGRLQALQAQERGRVADAAALADLLVPLLLERLRLPLNGPAAAPRAQRPSQAARPASPSVADFIDDMLAQERATSQ
jgi:hypothetical protein